MDPELVETSRQHRPQKVLSTKTVGHQTNLRFKHGQKTKPRRVLSYRPPPSPPPLPVACTLTLKDEDEEPPKRSLWQLLANGGIVFGLSICQGLVMALVTPILLELGLPEEYYTFTWFISPVLGVFLQPVLGAWSDRCTARWGRRRPFILALSVGVLVGLALTMNGEDIINATFADSQTTTCAAIVLTLLGMVMLDFCSDACDSPAKAYLLDTCRQDDQDRGLSLQALMEGLGAGLGYVFGGVDWDQTILATWVGSGQRVIFTFAAVSFVLSATVTLFSIKEIPLKKRDNGSLGHVDDFPVSPRINISSLSSLTPGPPLTNPAFDYGEVHSTYQTGSTGDSQTYSASNEGNASANCEDDTVPDVKQFRVKMRRLRRSSNYERAITPKYVEEEKYYSDGYVSEEETGENFKGRDQPDKFSAPNSSELIEDNGFRGVSFSKPHDSGTTPSDNIEGSADDQKDDALTVRMLFMAFVKMPNVMKRLCFSYFLGWLAMGAMLVFFTDFVGKTVFHGSPTAALGTTSHQNYHSGVKMGCWGLCIYAFSAAFYAALLDVLQDIISLHSIYFFGFFAFSIAAALCVMFPNTYVVLSLCVPFGIMSATLCTLPFTVLSRFHQSTEFVQDSPGNTKRGFGLDTSLLGIQIFLTQIVNAACLGPLISVTGTVDAVLLYSSTIGFVGCLWTALFVVYQLPGKKRGHEGKNPARAPDSCTINNNHII